VRKSWKTHFAELAMKNAEMATCKRLKVGSVIVKDGKFQVGTGFNGSVRGDVHCIDGECLVENNHCVRCVHSEANAIITAAKYGVEIEGTEIYVTHYPCFSCFKMIVNSGIKKVYFVHNYKDDKNVGELAAKVGIEIEQVVLESNQE
jgi:dCMP deaminase